MDNRVAYELRKYNKNLAIKSTPTTLFSSEIWNYFFYFLLLMILQDTVNVFLDHMSFTNTQLCTDYNQRVAGGPYAEEHCSHHETYTKAVFSLRTCKCLFILSLIKLYNTCSYILLDILRGYSVCRSELQNNRGICFYICPRERYIENDYIINLHHNTN